ncbi:hypothetical protein RYX36_011025, partial [Vicia faba]
LFGVEPRILRVVLWKLRTKTLVEWSVNGEITVFRILFKIHPLLPLLSFWLDNI